MCSAWVFSVNVLPLRRNLEQSPYNQIIEVPEKNYKYKYKYNIFIQIFTCKPFGVILLQSSRIG